MITTFAATPAMVTSGQSSTLTWAVNGATTLAINAGVGAVTGTSVQVTPSATTFYTLTATNASGSATKAVMVVVGSPPTITSFVATPAMVSPGQSSTLTWVVTGSPGLIVNPGARAVTGTSVKVTPSATTSYTLTATNGFGSATKSVTVTVGNPPTVTSFTATPAMVSAGQSSTLTWTVIGATTLAINPGVGAVTGTSVNVTPSATTSYTLTATNAFGSITKPVTVLVGSPPTITSLVATPAMVSAGQSSTLSWAVTGAPGLIVNPGVGAVTGTSVKVTPSATASYSLTATNPFGSATKSVTVLVGSSPTITSFTATPATVSPGQSSTLRWAVTGSPGLIVNPGVGAVTGTSVKVTPSATTTYTLSATNSFGSITATATVTVGSSPSITSFTATPAMVSPGQSSTLTWAVTGSPSLIVNPDVGAVTGTSVQVTPSATASYTLTAANSFGSATKSVTVMVGNAPTITSFTATPAAVTAGQFSTLTCAVTGSPRVIINPAVGAVTAASVNVTPVATTQYLLTATNWYGSVTATVTVTVLPESPPVINSFFTVPPAAGPGLSAALFWTTTGAASLSIDQGVGTVTGTSVRVSPSSTTTYTLTATNGAGSATAAVTVNYYPLTSVNSQLFYSEHSVYIIPPVDQVTWTGPNSYGSVYSSANVDSYVATLKELFPDDYFFVVVAANQLTPNTAPNVQPLRHTADGIGLGSTGVGVPSICHYNIGGGAVIDGAFGVLDHEIGHNWGIFLQPELADANGHWWANSTATGQMAGVYSDDGYVTDKLIAGDPVNGFTWTAVANIYRNETETFSAQDLYLQGFASTLPDIYVLDSPVYNPDHTVSYSSVTKYDQAWMVQKYGVRNPSYQASPKRLRIGFVYIARDQVEVLAVYQPIERSINHLVNAEQIDTTNFRFQVPFLVETWYRASLDALLADLDGNQTPTLSIPGPTSLVSSDGSAVVPYTAADPDGPAPVVSCVPASANCSITANDVALTGLASGTHFFTIKAEDAGGKKTFTHFVVDVQ
ncbi:MAG: hypothetical protein LAQ69_12310 [Acidobacteriia bacterium]|nr:hypothetical protein [Terriglobia bacterium]